MKGFAPVDFDAFHREVLPALLAAGRAGIVCHAAQGLGAFAVRIPGRGAYTYRVRPPQVEVTAGDRTADTIIELDHDTWEGLIHELEAPAGLIYASRVKCLRGETSALMDWEPGLRALYNGRRRYDPEDVDLRDRHGAPLDAARIFTMTDLQRDRDEMVHFLKAAGYLFVRAVFTAAEIDAFLAEADVLGTEARPGDRLSWWGRNASGQEILCRVTRASSKPRLGALPGDPRVLALKDLAVEDLQHRKGEGEGVTVIYKHPNMVEGLGDIPWHRDCGLGGHALICPCLIISIYLVAATPETGELRMLPGSRDRSLRGTDADNPRAPRGVSFHAAPGDVSLHYGDTLHTAPPPTRVDLDRYRISAILGFGPPGPEHHRGEDSYNAVLHQRDDGQIAHLEKDLPRERQR